MYAAWRTFPYGFFDPGARREARRKLTFPTQASTQRNAQIIFAVFPESKHTLLHAYSWQRHPMKSAILECRTYHYGLE